uniref:CCHC-type domain-containing protein n=1 Tax=Tanacetum cinerariifolium TaxID=118510 RepID=A0A699HZR4_TANCI|nr:hypothetical protein [Tanacetum cinerariifolium]
MSSNSDDIQAAGSDTRPPMLDRTDYDTLDTLGTTPEGGVLLGPERPRTYDDLNDNEKKQFDANVCATNIVLQGLPKYIYKLINHNIEAKAIWNNDGRVVVQNVQGRQNQRNFARGNGAASNERAQIGAGNVNACQRKPIKCFNCNGLVHITQNCTQPKRQHNSKAALCDWEQTNNFDAEVDDHPVRVLALNDDNIFQADECDAFNLDVDDEPTAQSIFMANLSLAGPTNQQADPSNASILSEVHDLENAIDPFNDVSIVPIFASSVLNNSYVLHDNDAYVPRDPLVTELNIYKEQVAIYEQHVKFELTLHEQKMDEQISILIRDRNQKEENLKKELHSAKRAQAILYDGNELLKMHHVLVLVTSYEEDLELAETTRIKMNDHMCVEKRVKITPSNYS